LKLIAPAHLSASELEALDKECCHAMRVLRLGCRRPTTLTAGWRGILGVALYRPHMYETTADLAHLQWLLDDSYNSAGPHLRTVITPERRLSAQELTSRLQGMCLLALATVTRDCRPLVGPVDGIFYRGAFYFGSSPESVRLRHIGQRPQVSATHLPGEELAVTVHGRAVPIDVRSKSEAGFRRALLDVYVPRYGPKWEEFLNSGPVYARIDSDRMFTLYMDVAR
jgi:nitroimidazol reductase NimA-like FMN-containing flavoprotein (pyridoxamine 5'-phosphate oxidase superfamily)